MPPAPPTDAVVVVVDEDAVAPPPLADELFELLLVDAGSVSTVPQACSPKAKRPKMK
jgi:hypothetical protein